MSRVLDFFVDDRRPLLRGRSGASAQTSTGGLLEVAGGSHSTCIVNDGGAIRDAIGEHLARGLVVGGARGYVNEAQLELAEQVMRFADDDEAKVYFTSGGTEAYETALRLAFHIQALRRQPHRSIVLGHRFSYHGMSIAARNAGDHPEHAIAPGGVDFRWPKIDEPSGPSIGCALSAFESAGAERVAAVVVEPVSGTTGGAVLKHPNYLVGLVSLCVETGAILIVDEVVTAFGRTGRGLYTGTLKPDMIIGGKCLAAGYAPIGCVILSGALCQELRQSHQALPLRLTFSGNALSCAAALAVQEYAAKSRLFDRVGANGALVGARLQSACKEAIPGAEVHGVGHLWGVHAPVRLGRGAAAVVSLKMHATERGVEFMGGWRRHGERETVHVTITPAFDLREDELGVVVDAAVALLSEGGADMIAGARP